MTAIGYAQYSVENDPAGRWLPLFFTPLNGSRLDAPTVGAAAR